MAYLKLPGFSSLGQVAIVPAASEAHIFHSPRTRTRQLLEYRQFSKSTSEKTFPFSSALVVWSRLTNAEKIAAE